MMTLSRPLNRRAALRIAAQGALLAAPFTRALAQTGPAEVSISMSSSGLPFGGLRIAEHGGLFAKHGLKPRLIVSESGNAATTALLARSVDFAGSGPSEALTARARGQEIIVVGNLYRGLSGSLVLATAVIKKLGVKPEAPVADRLKALDGLTIATPSATSAYTGPVKNGAAQVGAKPKLVYMAQPAMSAALETGAIHGMIGAAPFSIAPVVKGSGAVWISGPRAQFPAELMPSSSACLQTSEAYAKTNPEVVRKLQALLADLAVFIREKPADAKQALGKAYSTFDAATLDSVFEEDSENWSRPILTEADMEQERKILQETQSVPGLRDIDFKRFLRMAI
ncbi:ABC transporter substrate-binding protein [Bradyrhizobium sp. LHD-71]|uniref:ABC transporter substrate-binding protein n=1 Tax=Bradyrhizobium sp. LHD-71 TaxID=3072141 RepID=UPI00280D2E07|nr:ABC transporter substrate-binding protein [Bradyrhizobium sp. LHD-71]MDQ8728232.1 ABC transporter substrate-binding protein [Bradyrhizobium sp. LHD-71]